MSDRRAWRLPVAMVSIVAAMIAGCSNNDLNLASVSGHVTLDGQPVPGVLVTYKPRELQGTTSYGLTNDSGEYQLMYTRTSAGALPGDYEVSLTPPPVASKSERAELEATGEAPLSTPPALPARYQQAGILTATVKAGPNTIDFQLTRE